MKASKGAIKRGPAGDNDYSMLLGVAWMASKEFLKPAERASKSAGRASEPVIRALDMVSYMHFLSHFHRNHLLLLLLNLLLPNLLFLLHLLLFIITPISAPRNLCYKGG